MKRKPIGAKSRAEAPRRGRTDSERVDRLSDADIARAVAGDPDTFIPGPEFWRRARVAMPSRKVMVTMRMDADVVAWYRRAGRGYQSRMNAVLRSYMQAHRRQPLRPAGFAED